jgi:hypothetical protein
MQSRRLQDGAMNVEISGPCSVNNCTRLATHQEVGESAHWLFFVHYCEEHHRQLERGTPVGPVGIDSNRVQIHARGIEEPVAGGILPNLSPH